MTDVDFVESAPQWHEHGIDVLLSVWHLWNVGVKNPEDISRVLGTELHGQTIATIVEGVDQFITGPIELSEPVRCCSCGGLLNAVPCVYCRTFVDTPNDSSVRARKPR